MRTENQVNPLGIGTSTPRFSWQITSDRKGVVQTSYQILVASSREKLDRNEADLWDSGERNSDEQLWIPYQGKALLSGAQRPGIQPDEASQEPDALAAIL